MDVKVIAVMYIVMAHIFRAKIKRRSIVVCSTTKIYVHKVTSKHQVCNHKTMVQKYKDSRSPIPNTRH